MAESLSATRDASVAAAKRRIAIAAILGGGLGIHKFMLGYQRAGWIMLAIGLLGWVPFLIPSMIVMLIGVIEGVIYLRTSDEDFAKIYLAGKREWF